MLKLRLIQPGRRDEVFAFSNDCAIVGRKREGGVDIVVPQPFITGRHAMIMKGIVIYDLGSTNGTFVGGRRVKEHEPTLVRDGSFTLGRDEVRFVVETESADDFLVSEGTLPAHSFQAGQPVVVPEPSILREELKRGRIGTSRPAAPEFAEMRLELERTREEKARLSNELDDLRRSSTSNSAEAIGKLESLLRENGDLQQRVASLKRDLDAREGAASASLQVRLAEERTAEVQRLNAALEARIRTLEARPPEVRVVAGQDAISTRLLELEAQLEAQKRVEQSLRGELEVAQKSGASGKAAPPASELFFRLQRENQELREKLSRAEHPGAAASAPVPASNLFFQMQNENRDLRRRVAELEAGGPSAPTPNPSLLDQQERQRYESELQRLKEDLARAGRVPSGSGGAPPVPAVFPTPLGNETVKLLLHLADSDVDGEPARMSGAPGEFLTLETYRFVRQVERLGTRIAGNFLQMFDDQTMLPGLDGNLRKLTRATLDAPGNPRPRENLVRYLDELKGWLVASVGAPRAAAITYVRELRDSMTAESLDREAPISALRKMVANDAELWRRAQRRWNEISDTQVDERMVELTRIEALKLMKRAARE